jgi:hypothetical protein
VLEISKRSWYSLRQRGGNIIKPGIRVIETTAVEMIIDHFKVQFPKDCPKCRRRFDTLRDFYLHTTPTGIPISYDLEAGDLTPQRPLGAVAISNCQCGEPIALTSEGMPAFRYWELLLWAKTETRRRGISVAELLLSVRHKVRQKVLSESD